MARYIGKIQALILLGVAGSLILAAVPRLVASGWVALAYPVLLQVDQGESVEPDRLRWAAGSAEQALALDPENSASLLARLLLAQVPTLSEKEKKKIPQVLDSALAARPLHAYSWIHQANWNLYHVGDKQAALEEWRAAVRLAPYEPQLVYYRFAAGVYLYQVMTEQDRQLLKQEASIAFEIHHGRFRNFVRQAGLLEWAIFLLDDPRAKQNLRYVPD